MGIKLFIIRFVASDDWTNERIGITIQYFFEKSSNNSSLLLSKAVVEAFSFFHLNLISMLLINFYPRI